MVFDKLLTQLAIVAWPSIGFLSVVVALAPSKEVDSPSSTSFLGSPPSLRATPYVWTISKVSLSEPTEIRALQLISSSTAVDRGIKRKFYRMGSRRRGRQVWLCLKWKSSQFDVFSHQPRGSPGSSCAPRDCHTVHT